MPLSTRQRNLFLCLIAVFSVAWFWMLGILPLMHPDEGRYAEIPREMVASGDWVTPRLSGLLYFEKPALQYWLTAISYKALGESEFSARLATGLAGFLSILLVYICSRRLWGRETAGYAAIVCGSMLWMQALGHTLTLDMTLSFFLQLALSAFLIAHSDDATPNEQRYGMWLVWAAMAAAMMTKGLVGIVIPGATLFLYSLLNRHWAIWLRMHWFSGLAIFLVLTVPWFVVVSMRNPGFAEFFFIHEHFARYLTPEAKRTGPVWYFIPFLLLGLLPWTTLLPRILRESWTAAPGRFQPGRMLLIWSAFVFAFFSVSDSKLSSYILPMFPALAMLAGRSIEAAKSGELRRHVVFPVVVWMVPVIVLLFVPKLAGNLASKLQEDAGISPEQFQVLAHYAAAGALLFVGLALIGYQLLKRDRKYAGIAFVAVAGIVVANALLYTAHAGAANLRSSKQLAAVVLPQLAPQVPLFSVGYYEQTMPFYLRRTMMPVGYTGELRYGEHAEPDRWIQVPADFVKRWNQLPAAAAVMKPDKYREMTSLGVQMRVIYQDSARIFVVKP